MGDQLVSDIGQIAPGGSGNERDQCPMNIYSVHEFQYAYTEKSKIFEHAPKHYMDVFYCRWCLGRKRIVREMV